MNQHIEFTAGHQRPIDVHVSVRAESLTLSRRGAIFGEIFITLNGRNFPDGRRNDLIVVVLGWWCEQCANLLREQLLAELWFMDGPFLSQLQKTQGEVWAIRFLRHRAVASPGMVETEPVSGLADPVAISAQEFVGSVVRASEVILNECAHRGWTTPEIGNLKREWGNFAVAGLSAARPIKQTGKLCRYMPSVARSAVHTLGMRRSTTNTVTHAYDDAKLCPSPSGRCSAGCQSLCAPYTLTEVCP